MAIKVFIDTNIYENSNFSFYNKQFSKFRELIKEESIELLYNEIVYREVYQHIEENLTNAVSEYNQVIEVNRAFAPFRLDGNWTSRISKIKADDMIRELQRHWDHYIMDVHAIKISISEVEVDEIVDKYFKKEYPFEAKKPTEFKDAICIDSILQYYDSIEDEIICVVTADKGFRKSFKGRKEFVTFPDLNKFLNFAISQTDHLAVEIEKAFESGILDERIAEILDNQLYLGTIEIEDVYDNETLLNIKTQSIEYGYIHEFYGEGALVVANASINVEAKYTVCEEDDDYHNWGSFVTYRAIFCINLEIEISTVFETDDKDLSVNVDINDVIADTNLYLSESDIIESEIIHDVIDDEEEEETFNEYARYCPDCECKMDYENEMGAFCRKCAPNH